MDRLAFSVAAVLLLGAPAGAQEQARYGAEYRKCDGNTVEMIDCVAELREEWDQRLNATYQEIMGKLPPERQAQLRDAQRKWISYRDANCLFYRMGEGTIAALESATCLYAMTRDRATELERMLEN